MNREIPVTLDEAFRNLLDAAPEGWAIRSIWGPGFARGNKAARLAKGWAVFVNAKDGYRFRRDGVKGEAPELIDALLDAAEKLVALPPALRRHRRGLATPPEPK